MRRSRCPWLWAALVLPLCAAAQGVTYRVERAARPPQIDGILEDACWQEACRIESFSLLGQGAPTSGLPATVALLTYDADAVYVAFRCVEPRMGELQAAATEHDGRTWADDGVEVFLNPGGDRRRYVQLAVNTAGVVMDGSKKSPEAALDTGWDSGAEVAVRREARRYTMEIRMPLAALPLTGPDGPWTFHLARNRRVAGQHLTSLRSPVNGFHEIAAFDVLAGIRLPEYPVAVLAWDVGERFQGINACRLLLANRGEASARVTVEVAVGEAASSETLEVASGGTAEAAVPWRLTPADAGKVLRVAVRCGGRVLQQRAVRIEAVPEVFGTLRREVYYWSAHRPVRLTVPVRLGARSREGAILHWRALARDGAQVGEGQTLVRGTEALVRLCWTGWWEGRYRLELELQPARGKTRRCERTVRLIANPWGD